MVQSIGMSSSGATLKCSATASPPTGTVSLPPRESYLSPGRRYMAGLGSLKDEASGILTFNPQTLSRASYEKEFGGESAS